MNLNFAYKYAELCGIVKMRISFNSYTEKQSRLHLVINGKKLDLSFDGEYLKKIDFIDFGLNSYKFSLNEPNFLLLIDLYANDILQSTLRAECRNDAKIHEFICDEMATLPALIPLPLSYSYFKNLGKEIYPSPYIFEDLYGEFKKDGFIVFKKFYNSDFMDRVSAELDNYCAKRYMGYDEGSSSRVQHLHTLGGEFAVLFKDTRIRDNLKNIFGVEMLPCQSLACRYGSQQSVHSDYVHLTPYPTNLMCGVWVALEDVLDDAGELAVYPGSQVEKKYIMEDFGLPKINNGNYSSFGNTFGKQWHADSSKYRQTKAMLKKGDVLVWDGNLLHEGLPRNDTNLTRKSVVFHFFGKGAACYYDATGDIGFSGELI